MKCVLGLALVCAVGTKPLGAQAYCFDTAAARYGVPQTLIMAIAQQESGLRASVVSQPNRNGSRDIGLMQINSSWLPYLARHGIHAQDLFDPCVNALVGTWILASNFQRWGYTVNSLGAYNAANPDIRLRYATAVLKRAWALQPNRELPSPVRN